jgi:hypothetical protein
MLEPAAVISALKGAPLVVGSGMPQVFALQQAA